MTKQRSNYVYKLVGGIKKKDKRTSEKYPDSYYYQLKTEIENKVEVKKMFAFSNRLEKKIWQEIEQDNYLGKKYVFSCKNYMGSYFLVD